MADIEQRARFDAWAESRRYSTLRHTKREDLYMIDEVNMMWRAWQAALASQAQVPEDVRAREVRAIGAAVERAAEVLPEFWSIRIELECGSGIVSLFDPDGRETMIDSAETFSDQINEAIEAAIGYAPAPEVSNG